MFSVNFIISLTTCALVATLFLLSCAQQQRKPDLQKLCGNWQSVLGKPDVMVFKEGNLYKMTVFKTSSLSSSVRPETYLIVCDNGNLFINAGFRIDIGYNEQSDVLTFSTHGDYTRMVK